jgi:hypothetical protein
MINLVILIIYQLDKLKSLFTIKATGTIPFFKKYLYLPFRKIIQGNFFSRTHKRFVRHCIKKKEFEYNALCPRCRVAQTDYS